MMLWVYISRAINVYVFQGHPDEMLSSRVHRECWGIEPLIDALFYLLRDEYDHCYHCHQWERKDMDDDDDPMLPLDERFRQAQQYSFDLQPRRTQTAPARPPVWVCPQNCDICPRCGNSSNSERR